MGACILERVLSWCGPQRRAGVIKMNGDEGEVHQVGNAIYNPIGQ